MREIRNYQLPNGHVPFEDWLMALTDKRARAAVFRRIDRIAQGNFGDQKYLQDGVRELRIDLGPGYRVYFALDGETVVLLLCAGSKRTQTADISRAVRYWKDYRKYHGKD